MPRSFLIDAMMTDCQTAHHLLSCPAVLSCTVSFRAHGSTETAILPEKLKQPEYDWQAIKESLDIIGASERDVRLRLINRKLLFLKRADDA